MGFYLTTADDSKPATKYTRVHRKPHGGPKTDWVLSTKYTDSETGLLYFGHRYYMPENGRWGSRDPLEENKDLNIYIFVLNQPVILFDLLGLSTFGCSMTLNPDPQSPIFGSVADMVCSYSCCRCKQVQFKQTAFTSIKYLFLSIFPKTIFANWHQDHNGSYYDEDYKLIPCHSDNDTGFATMGERPGFDSSWRQKLVSLLQMFKTEAVCTAGPDAGKVYATWHWSHSYNNDPPSISRSWFPHGNIGF